MKKNYIFTILALSFSLLSCNTGNIKLPNFGISPTPSNNEKPLNPSTNQTNSSNELINVESQQYITRGDDYLKNNDYKNAIEVYKKIPTNGQHSDKFINNIIASYSNYGIDLLKNESFDDAIKSFNEAYKISNDSEIKNNLSTAYNNKALNFSKNKDYEEAIKYYKKSLIYNPDNGNAKKNLANAYNNLSIQYNEEGYYNKAISLLDKAIEIDPNNSLFKENRSTDQKNLQRSPENYCNPNLKSSKITAKFDNDPEKLILEEDENFVYIDGLSISPTVNNWLFVNTSVTANLVDFADVPESERLGIYQNNSVSPAYHFVKVTNNGKSSIEFDSPVAPFFSNSTIPSSTSATDFNVAPGKTKYFLINIYRTVRTPLNSLIIHVKIPKDNVFGYSKDINEPSNFSGIKLSCDDFSKSDGGIIQYADFKHFFRDRYGYISKDLGWTSELSNGVLSFSAKLTNVFPKTNKQEIYTYKYELELKNAANAKLCVDNALPTTMTTVGNEYEVYVCPKKPEYLKRSGSSNFEDFYHWEKTMRILFPDKYEAERFLEYLRKLK